MVCGWLTRVAVIVVVLVLNKVTSYPEMVPDSACGWLAPWHEPYTDPSNATLPYKLMIYQHEVLANSVVQGKIVLVVQ